MALHTSVWDGCPLWAWGQGAETWGWEGGPRKAPAVDCEETTWGVGNEELCKQECSWRKLRPPQRGSTIVEWCASLLMCQPLPPWALWRAHPPPQSQNMCPYYHLSYTPLSFCLGNMLTPITDCPAWWDRVLCQTLEQTLVEGTNTEVGLKPQLKPRGHATEKKSWTLSLQLHKPWNYTSTDGFLNPVSAKHPKGQ